MDARNGENAINSSGKTFPMASSIIPYTMDSKNAGYPFSQGTYTNKEEAAKLDSLNTLLLQHAQNDSDPKETTEEIFPAEGHLEETTNVIDRKLFSEEPFSSKAPNPTGVSAQSQFVDIQDKVQVESADGTSRYLSVSKWEDLNLSPDLLRGIYQKGFHKPSKIQAAALPVIIGESSNLIAQAKNGSGKTAAFALCMISKINTEIKDPQSLCLCPTRELARQILAVVEELGKYTQTSTYLAIPQHTPYDVAKGGQLVVGTPGKLIELFKRRIMPVQAMRLLVLDEADEMIDYRNNMAPQVQQIRRFLPSALQVLLFSATFPENVKEFAYHMVPKSHKITVEKESLSLDAVAQFYMVCSNEDHKFQVLSDLYGSMTIGQSVIFTKTRKSAFELAWKMKHAGHAISLICGTQSQGVERMDHATRDKIMSEFRNGETRVLICTDVLSRGIDVPQVTLVINYDLPMDFQGRVDSGASTSVSMETYIHRIGRTGRFGLKGIAISLVYQYEIFFIKDIADFYRCSIQALSVDAEEIEEMVAKLRL